MVPAETVQMIIELWSTTDKTFRQISDETGVSRGTISNIVRTNGVRLSRPLTSRERLLGKDICSRCGGPLPCIECAIIMRRQSGIQGKEPPNGFELALELDDNRPLDEEGTTVAKAAAKIRDNWPDAVRISRAGGVEELSIPFVEQPPIHAGVAPGKDK